MNGGLVGGPLAKGASVNTVFARQQVNEVGIEEKRLPK